MSFQVRGRSGRYVVRALASARVRRFLGRLVPGPDRVAARGEDAFTLVEVLIAGLILVLSMMSVGTELGTQFISLQTSNEQAQAGAYMAQAIEQIRALPYVVVANGMSTQDLVNSTTVGNTSYDPNITSTTTNGVTTYHFNGVPSEAIADATVTYTQAPLVPHQQTKTGNGITYTIRAYPTLDTSAGTGVIRVTVVVSWMTRQGHTQTLSDETLVYSPTSGCLTDTNHPFAAPCQPFFFSTASAGGAVITVVPDPNGASGGILGLSGFTSMELDLPEVTSSALIEQTTTMQGSARSSGGNWPDGDLSTGIVEALSEADDDPATNFATNQTTALSQSSSVLQAKGSGSYANSLTITPSASDSGSTTSTVDAASSQGCDDLSGTAQTTGLPCSGSWANQSAAASMALGLYSGTASLGTATLASVGAQPSSYLDRTFDGQFESPSGSYCAGTSGDGCVHAGAQRSLGTVTLGGLPSQFLTDGAAPSGWGTGSANALITLSSYSDQAWSESGAGITTSDVSASVPITGAATPTLKYWNGTGYTSLPVNWGGSPPTITIPTVTATDNAVPGGAVTVSMSATLQLGSTSTAASIPTGGCTSTCTASAKVSSPITGTITYTVTQGATVIADLQLDINLGSSAATSSYEEAP